MKTISETKSFSFPQVFLIGLVLTFLLRILTGLLGLAIATIGVKPIEASFQGITNFVPAPFLVLLLPLVVALVIVFFSGPKWEHHALPQPQPNPLLNENERLFSPRYTPQQVFNIMTTIAVFWLVILLAQLAAWWAFRGYISP